MIEAAAQAVARALRLLIQKRPQEAEQEVAAGYAALSIDRELLLLLDARTLRAQLDDDRLAMAVRLLICDAEVRESQGETSAAVRRLKAARRLLAEHPAPDAEIAQELERVERALNKTP